MNNQEVFCIFHELCFDPFHMALSIVVVFASIALMLLLCQLIWWLAECADHTSYCNELAHDHARDIINVEKWCFNFENRLSELEETAVKRK